MPPMTAWMLKCSQVQLPVAPVVVAPFMGTKIRLATPLLLQLRELVADVRLHSATA